MPMGPCLVLAPCLELANRLLLLEDELDYVTFCTTSETILRESYISSVGILYIKHL